MCQTNHHEKQQNAPNESIHGHVILKWLADAPLSSAALKARVAGELGEQAQFHTCDTSGLSLEALLALLAERGKITQVGDGWQSDLSRMCNDA